MQHFFTQGVAVLFSQTPGLGELRLLLEQQGFSIKAVEDSTEWPEMQGPCVTLATDFDTAAACWVDICDRSWPDDMGTQGEPTMLTSAHAMGAYGPFVYPGAFQRALQAPGYKNAVQDAQQHQAFVRVRISRFVDQAQEGSAEDSTATSEAPPAKELSFVLKVAAALASLPAAQFYFNPNSELILPIQALKELLTLEPLPVLAVCRSQGSPINESWSLVESIGMRQLGLPDHEFAWADAAVSRKEQLDFLIDFLHYHVGAGDSIHHGNSTDGPHNKRWRAEERADSCSMPPRPVLHWTMEGSPAEPELLAANAGGQVPVHSEAVDEAEQMLVEEGRKVEAWLGMRDAIRTRAVQWLRSPAFLESYYDDAHPPLAFKVAMDGEMSRKEAREAWKSAQIFGIQTPQLWDQYQQLAAHGQVLFAVPLMSNPGFHKEPDTLLPCAVVVATSQTSKDILLASIFAQMAYEIYVGAGDDKKFPGTAKIMENDDYRLFHREVFPLEETQGTSLALYSILLRQSWMKPEDVPIIPIIAVPGPQGAFVQIPWHVVIGGPPPLSRAKGKWAELAELDRQADKFMADQPAWKRGCARITNIFSVLFVLFLGYVAVNEWMLKKQEPKPSRAGSTSPQPGRRTISTVKSWSQPPAVTALVTVVKGEEYQPLIADGLQGSGFLFKIEVGLILAGSSRHQFESPDHPPGQMIDLDDLDVTLDTEQLIRQPDSQVQLVTKLSKSATCLEYRHSDVLKNGDALRLILEKGQWIDGTLQTRRDVPLTSTSAVLRMQVQTNEKVTGRSGSPIVHAKTGRVVGVMLGADKAEAPTTLEFETINIVLVSAK